MGLFGGLAGLFTTGRAASAISNADIAAEHGVLDAAGSANAALGNAISGNEALLGGQFAAGQGEVNQATAGANQTLNGLLGQQSQNLQPYLNAGAAGTQALQNYALSNPQFSFDPSQYFNSPAYQFQLQQGQQAIQGQESAQGLANSSSTLKALQNYGQGLASTYYNQAFNQAQSSFQTNQNATLANLSSLVNAGEFGTQQYNQGLQTLGSQEANNTVNAGLWSGNQRMSLGDLLANEQLGAAGQAGQNSLNAATTAGNFAVNAGQARSSGIIGTGAALGQAVGGLGSFLTQVPSLIQNFGSP